MFNRVYTVIVVCVLCLMLPLISAAVTVTTKAQFLAELPLTPGKEIIITDQTITGGGAWGALTITGDCTQANPCVIRSQTPQGVIFSGQGAGEFCLRGSWYTFSGFRWAGQTSFGTYSSAACGAGPLIAFDGAQNVTVDDIEIANLTGAGVPIAWMELGGGRETLNTTLSNAVIGPWAQTDSSAIEIYARDSRGWPEGIDLTNIVFKDRTVTGGGGILNYYWLRIGNSQASIDDTKYASGDADIVITNVTVENDATGGYDAFHFKSDDIIIQDSTFDRAGRVTARQGLDWVIRRNTFKNCRSSACIRIYGHGHTIANNLFYGGGERGIQLGKGNGLVEGNDYVAFNNSFVIGNTFDGYTTAALDNTVNSSGNNQGTTTVFASNVTFYNNVVRQQLGTMFLGPGGCGIFAAVGYNARDGAATAGCMTSGSNNVNAAPLWSDPNAGNYALQAASPLINAGTAVAGTTEDNTDINQATRSVPPDIGAYEFGGGSPPAGTCDQIFGGATGYELCAETGTHCKFNVTLGGSNCDTLCASFGKECTAAFDNSTPLCTENGVDTCQTVRADEICECTIADAGPPSPPGSTTNVTQRAWRMSGALALNDSAEALAPENTDLATYINGRWNMTISVTGDASIDAHTRDFILRYQYCNPTCGSYTVVTADCASHPTCLLNNPDRSSGEAIASALLTIESRNFNMQSQYIDGEAPNGGEVSEVSIAADDQWEATWGLSIGATAAVGAVINYRVYNADGTPLDTYLETPQVTVGNGGFIRSGGSLQ